MGGHNHWYEDGSGWIGDRLDGVVIHIPTRGRWKLHEKVSEKATEQDPNAFGPAEASAVFRCHSLDTESSGSAIMKLHMQIYQLEKYDELPSQASDREHQATDQLHVSARRELANLTRLTERYCKSSPKLLGSLRQVQGPEDWVPGGYMLYLLMEEIPGQSLRAWLSVNNTDDTRREIQPALKRAILDLAEHGIYYADPRSSNAMWNPQTQQCFIIDYEAADCWGVGKVQKWSDSDFFWWNLEVEPPL